MHLLAVRATGSGLLPALFAAGSMFLSAATVAQSSQAQTGNAAAQTSAGAFTPGAATTGTSANSDSTNSRAADTAPSPDEAATGNNARNTAAARGTPSAVQQQSVAAPAVEAPGIVAPDLTTPNTQAHYFSDVDYSNDYRLTWEEIVTAYESELREGGWTRIEFIEEFDSDGDEFLDEDEYSDFLAEVGLDEPENRSSFIDID